MAGFVAELLAIAQSAPDRSAMWSAMRRLVAAQLATGRMRLLADRALELERPLPPLALPSRAPPLGADAGAMSPGRASEPVSKLVHQEERQRAAAMLEVQHRLGGALDR
ncbi:hypothetical protein GPECTOR_80g146 [Gonium pectorale]|uniref:Uncharacterized protein n=1 Tax=Gonium pectorale TaxID=33097 RepID=A0A150G1N3_GONPE|nr:hypothetical protein GPECTOR_80g146 [Gonium pectorale]|eukprot:KXZ43786.1 hypothetical protein GPECTOR_80g146 [Gonium pectorale]